MARLGPQRHKKKYIINTLRYNLCYTCIRRTGRAEEERRIWVYGAKNTLTNLAFIDHEPGRTHLNQPRSQLMLVCKCVYVFRIFGQYLYLRSCDMLCI